MSQTPSTLTRTVLLLGYGPRVSTGIKDHFLAQGYNITTVSRSARPELDGVDKLTHIVGDCSTLAAIDAAFKQTTKKYGPISTVIYNAGSFHPLPVQGSPFSFPVPQLQSALDAPFWSAYHAAQLLLESKYAGPKHFIATGNLSHKEGHAWQAGFAQSLAKSALATMIEIGAKAYGRKGGPYFYHIWETYADGTALWGKVSPEGHADIVQQLVQLDEQGENEVPFIVTDGKARRAPKDLVYMSDW